jgi:DNA polymerase-3 subunit alpha
MASPRFVHLHLHTDYSLLDGACKVSQLVEETARREVPAVAVTDHGNLFAAANFFHAATTVGVRPIIGCEVYVAPGGHKNRGAESERSNHLVLLCENEEGYRNLVRLVSTGFLDGFYYKPRVDHDLLAKHSRGLIALSACLRGEVNDAILAEKPDAARAAAYRLQEIFGKGNFFLEVQDQKLDVDERVNCEVVRVSRDTGIPLVATNDCHYLTHADAKAQEVLMCIQTGKTMSMDNRMRFATDQFYYKTPEEMALVFGDLPEALERTVAIAERCKVRIQSITNPFPEFHVPEGYTLDSYFEKVVREGFVQRVPELEQREKKGLLRHALVEYDRRLSDEVEMIKKMRFAGYFLIVWDFIHYARGQGVPVGPGRGSAAGSLVSYALRITDVDPLQYDLLFERFLNPERVSMPDIDIDFCMRRRGEIIEYVRKTYGSENVAQIITFGTMAAKAAIKDVGRAMDIPFGDVDRLAKLIPNELNITLAKALKDTPQLVAQCHKDEKVGELMEVAQRLEGLARHASTHAAGVVISPEPLINVLPLYRTNRDEIITQYDMGALERLGLLKMDFLGLTTLTVLDDAVKMIEQNRGEKVDLAALPLDDAVTYGLFARAETTGIFQFESRGMRDLLRRYQPSRLEDLTALNALFRPGPLQGGMVDDFIARKQGKKRVTFDLPELKEILEETYGVILYQEQVMQIANRLAGFTLGEADLLRRAMGKKKHEVMAAQREKFVAGCVTRKVTGKKAAKIFDLMEEFAGYGFNKSHSCAYALLAYQTAYLKVHYPVEFVSAVLTSETGDTDKVVKYISEARGMGITVLPPDVNSSGVDFTAVGERIRFGLRAIKNVGENTVKGILEARSRVGRFENLFQFCAEVESRLLNRRVLESLIRAGALDDFCGHRAQLMAVVDRAMERAQRKQQAQAMGQHGLFGSAGQAPETAEDLPEVPQWPEHEVLAAEFATLGFYVSGHPLDRYAGRLKELRAVELGTLDGHANGEDIIAGGIIVQSRPMRSKKGARWGIFTLQDPTGAVETLVFPEAFARLEGFLKQGAPLVVKGRLVVEDAGTKISVQDVRHLDKFGAEPTQLLIRVDRQALDSDGLDRIQNLIDGQPGGCNVTFELVGAEGEVALMRSTKGVKPGEELVAELRGIAGVDGVELLGQAK